MNTSDTRVYAGEDRPEQLDFARSMLALAALTAAHDSTLLRPMTKIQVGNALEGLQPPPKECKARLAADHTAKVVAALIAAESDLYALSGRYEDIVVTPLLNELQRALRATGRRLIDKGCGLRGWIHHDIWVVAIDETRLWHVPDHLGFKSALDRIESVYCLDRSEITHLCSFSGSYYLYHIDTRPIMKPNTGDELVEEARDFCQSGSGPEDIYVDQGEIDRMIERNQRGTVYHWGNPGFDLDSVVEAVEADWEDELLRHPQWTRRTLAPQEIEERVTSKVMEAVEGHLTSNSVL